jgi:biopolymer transport protein ExbD
MDLTPLIDVVFLLLIFFMVATTFDEFSAMNIELPQGKGQGEIIKEIEKIIVIIDKNKDIIIRIKSSNNMVEDLKVEDKQLDKELKNVLEKSTQKNVDLVAHKELDYGYIVGTIEEIKSAGAKGLNIEVENRI